MADVGQNRNNHQSAPWKRQGYDRVDTPYIEQRSSALVSRGYREPRWLTFCRHFVSKGFEVRIHEAPGTESKYVQVRRWGASYLVRFSTHAITRRPKSKKKVNFVVGPKRDGSRGHSCADAIKAAEQFFADKAMGQANG